MTNLIKNKKFTRITALLLAVAVIFGTMFALPVSAASGDKVTITFAYCYDSAGNIIRYKQTTVNDGYTVGTVGEELCKIFADGKEAYCIEPGHTLYSGNTLTESASTVWKNLGSAKQKAINLLDRYEGYPSHYFKQDLPVKLNNGSELTAMVYIMNLRQQFGLPSASYYDTVSQGYQDYLDKPNRGNADELILRIAETHAELFGDREKYVSYIAQRPRVEKVSSHGLFTDDGVPIVLSDVQKEVAESKSNVWTHIISLKREDAERLGYNNAKAWMNLIRSQRNMIAENMKIAPENFRWYAAFHNEGHHPHIHMIAYSTKPNEAYLTEKGIENIKSNLAKVIFRQDLISIYQKQTEHRDKLRAEARDIVDDLVSKINSEIYISASIQHKLLELADRLSKTSGKKVYGYIKPDVKAIVDSIVEELASDDRIKKLYDLWYEQKENTIRTYTDEIPERIPLVDNKEFKSIKNVVIKEAVKLNLSEDEVEENENTDEEAVSNPFEYEGNTSAELAFDSCRGVLYPHYSIKTNRNSVAVSSLYLLRYLCNMIQNQLRFEEKQKAQRTDKKLQHKINDKKRAQGLKM